MLPVFFKRLAVEIGSGGELPTEFRLFTAGINDTENGKFLFDQKAAQSVMSAYQKWGVDVAIDLEHQMLDGASSPDPTAKDARGWCNLELRPDGSLWAVNVRWNPDGAARLTNKTQRYVSPAFEVDPKTQRVSKIINIAITSIPATHNTPALVAASRKMNMTKQGKKALAMIKALAASGGMSSALVSKAMQALQDQDGDAALSILQSIIAAAAGGEPDADGEGDPSDGPDSSAVPEQNAADAAGADPKTDDNAPASVKPENGPPAKPEKASVIAASLSSLMRMTGAKTLSEAVSNVAEFHKSHLELETGRQQLAKERATLESAERRKLCVQLVTLGAEFPATIWADAETFTPKKRWQNMPIEELRSHVQEQQAARGGKRAPNVAPPEVNAAGNAVGLTPDELKICKELNCDPVVYLSLKKQNPIKAGS